MLTIRNGLGKFVNALCYIGMVICLALSIVVSINVILSKFTTVYIPGTSDMVEMGMVIIVFFGIAALQVKKGHVSVTMFVDMFPPLVGRICQAVVMLIETVFVFIMTYCGFLRIAAEYSKGTATDIIHLLKWPFCVFMVIGLVLYTLLMVIDTIVLFTEIPKSNKAAQV